MKNRDVLIDKGYENTIVFENPDYDKALIGVSESGRAIYDHDLMVESLMEYDGITEEQALDYISCNTIGSLPNASETAPIVMYRLNGENEQQHTG